MGIRKGTPHKKRLFLGAFLQFLYGVPCNPFIIMQIGRESGVVIVLFSRVFLGAFFGTQRLESLRMFFFKPLHIFPEAVVPMASQEMSFIKSPHPLRKLAAFFFIPYSLALRQKLWVIFRNILISSFWRHMPGF